MPRLSDKGCCVNFRLFFWNPKTKFICKRTGPNWGQFFLFYLGFYLILMALTAYLCVIIIHYVQRYQTSWYTLYHLGENPSLSMRPVAKKQLIIYALQDVQMSPSSYIDEIKNFLEAYQKQDKDTFQECSSSCLNSSKPCYFNISTLGPCGKEPYGYDTMSPCVLIKLNKNFGWLPCLPSNDPPRQSKNIEVKCEGHKPADKDHYLGIEIYPKNGFPISFFPYAGQKNYLSPLVAVKVDNPLSGVLVTIECSSKYEGEEDSSVIFQVLVGEK